MTTVMPSDTNASFAIVDNRELSIQIAFIDGLHKDVHGLVYSSSTDKYHILLNAADTKSQQEKSFLHECLHIFRGDLERESMNVNQVEMERHCFDI